jgi:hypothetical protein
VITRRTSTFAETLMTIVGKFVAAAAMLAVTAGTAGAQISFTTQGFFSGTGTPFCRTVAAASASCSGGGLTLSFEGMSGVSLANGTIATLGTFNVTGYGNVTFDAVDFNLLVSQTTPTVGGGSFIGALTGTVNSVDGINTLIWTPNPTTTIGSVTYQLLFDNFGPAAGVGLGIPSNSLRSINALVTSTTAPEPASIVLFGTGFAGLYGIARRKKSRA